MPGFDSQSPFLERERERDREAAGLLPKKNELDSRKSRYTKGGEDS